MPSSDQGCVRDTADLVVFLLSSKWTFLKIGSRGPAEQEQRGQKRTDTNVSARHITKVSGKAGIEGEAQQLPQAPGSPAPGQAGSSSFKAGPSHLFTKRMSHKREAGQDDPPLDQTTAATQAPSSSCLKSVKYKEKSCRDKCRQKKNSTN